MKLTICMHDGNIFNLEISDSTTVSQLSTLIESESGMVNKGFELLKEGQPISKSEESVKQVGIIDNDLLYVIPAESSSMNATQAGQSTLPLPHLDFRSIQVPRVLEDHPFEAARRLLLNGSPYQRTVLQEKNPELFSALEDPVEFRRIAESQQSSARRHREELESILSADSLDVAVQERIENLIRQRNIDIQMENALEFYPETFGQVTMLYINCKIKENNIKAFVDSGAQSTLISEECAKRCNLDSSIDKRWAGKAYGVGTQTIVGRIHNGLVEIQGSFFPTSFIVLQDQALDLLIGLDMLKRHQCCIDLKHNVLKIDNGRVEVPFLPESELPITALNPELFDPHDKQNKSSSSFDLSVSQRTKVEQLMSHGLAREKAIDELCKHGWNIDAALASYLQRSDS